MKMVRAKIKMFLVLSGAKRSRRTQAGCATLQWQLASPERLSKGDFAQDEENCALHRMTAYVP